MASSLCSDVSLTQSRNLYVLESDLSGASAIVTLAADLHQRMSVVGGCINLAYPHWVPRKIFRAVSRYVASRLCTFPVEIQSIAADTSCRACLLGQTSDIATLRYLRCPTLGMGPNQAVGR